MFSSLLSFVRRLPSSSRAVSVANVNTKPFAAILHLRPDSVELDSSLKNLSENDSRVRLRAVPGRSAVPCVRVPTELQRAVVRAVAQGHDLAQLQRQANKLRDVLAMRRLPCSAQQVRTTAEALRQTRLDELDEHTDRAGDDDDDQQLSVRQQRIQRKIQKKMRQVVYHWEPVVYGNDSKCLSYCLARMAADYASLRRVLREIEVADPCWSPDSVLDFGSGVGSSFWACHSIWPSAVREYYMVDPSRHMNDLNELLIKVQQF